MAARQTEQDACYDRAAAARSALYTVLARAFDNPDRAFHAAAVDGSLAAEFETYLDRAGLVVSVPRISTDRSHEDLAGSYNELFTLGHSEYIDRTDGSMDSEGPPVPLYESKYRDAAWVDVNQDLARAYDHFDVSVSSEERDHHDNLRLELEFAAYLARRDAIGETAAGRARRDFLDRHLDPFATALSERLAAVEDGFYTDLAGLLESVVQADLEALRETHGGGGDGQQ